jgi:hypothetical protein
VNHKSNPPVTIYSLNMTTNAKERITNTEGFLSVEAISHQKYFEVRAPFDPISLLKSPMGMMIGFTVLMMFCMKNMPDPEELKREAEALKKQDAA